jgi:hypothetical protein
MNFFENKAFIHFCHYSPQVQVLSHSHPADLIEVDGRSLKVGIIGEDLRTIIDARRADPGQISAQCSGPSGPEYCELLDNRDGTVQFPSMPKGHRVLNQIIILK